ncbi:MAG TPA: UvrD-helicase domain-containing protein [Candidatus Paceibacterota bacterium]|jgi:DNA helicase-2/ATP-dependent DNA helicase PcrA|nr:UvrD-helicase domain-containing protein [Candidatus Paceibacterota bacterium]
MQHLKGLNDKQREAALHMKGPLLIVAGAGAGKTKTITHRIVNLIKEGVSPNRILAVTFTNKAAKEMRERVIAEIKKNSNGVAEQNTSPFVSTFHSLGVYIIKENATILGLTKYFTILDEPDANSIIKEILKELSIDPKQYEPKKIKNIISREKGKFTHLEDYIESHGSSANPLSKIIAQVWGLYEKKKLKENALDFDDLLLKATKLLQDNKEVRKIYQDKWEYIHIDEYQDTNEVQYLMSKLLSNKEGQHNKNIVVVGDADQNIYSWRGANLKNILNFEKDYPEAKIIMLEENYRSTKNILEAANVVIKKNKYRPDKNLFTNNDTGEKIGLYEALDENDEADFVATKILEIIDGKSGIEEKFSQSLGDELHSTTPSKISLNSTFENIAVLYRANFQSRALEEAMLRYNIPYQVLGVKFFERREIKDTLAYLRAALNPQSLSDIKRIINFPARGIGKVTLAKIFSGDTENLPIKMRLKINNFYKILEEIKEKIQVEKPSLVIKFVVTKSGIEHELKNGTEEEVERLENIKELATLALKYDNLQNAEGNTRGIEKLLEDASLASDQDSIMLNQEKVEKKSVNAVKLMTVHAAKGLEFNQVFISGLEDGLFPHQRHGAGDDSSDSEEERRLFYVALTRARNKLFLSFANFRTIFGARQINMPSEFISDIPPDILEKEGEQNLIKTIYI